VYRTPATEFELSRLEWTDGDAEPVTLPGGAPRILVVIDGSLSVPGGLSLDRGQSLWIPANDPDVVLTPSGWTRAFVATPGA
jgi:mannose-6-phosphate isomerase